VLLALDTSAVASAALLATDDGGGRVLAARAAHDPRRHAEVLQPMVGEVLAEVGAGRRDVTAVVVGVGPGPYTGLRVGMAAALTLGAALDVPVHGVCSLDAVARATADALGDALPDVLGVATDARRREVYWATYGTADGLRRTGGPDVGAAADVAGGAGRWVGRGVVLYPDHLAALPAATADGVVRDDLRDPAAAALGLVAADALAGRGALALVPVEPLYLRRPDAVATADPGAPAPVR
jgi:tRNA threonylcarbamoyladenosine biosynthesis protein TsaB